MKNEEPESETSSLEGEYNSSTYPARRPWSYPCDKTNPNHKWTYDATTKRKSTYHASDNYVASLVDTSLTIETVFGTLDSTLIYAKIETTTTLARRRALHLEKLNDDKWY